jgi:hypothetical protein
MRECAELGNGCVAIAFVGTRCEAVEDAEDLRELEDDESRESRSRTTCGISTRCACANSTLRSLRYVLSFVRCGEGERLRSSRLSFLERELAGLRGGVELESMDGFRRRVGARITALYASLLLA